MLVPLFCTRKGWALGHMLHRFEVWVTEYRGDIWLVECAVDIPVTDWGRDRNLESASDNASSHSGVQLIIVSEEIKRNAIARNVGLPRSLKGLLYLLFINLNT